MCVARGWYSTLPGLSMALLLPDMALVDMVSTLTQHGQRLCSSGPMPVQKNTNQGQALWILESKPFVCLSIFPPSLVSDVRWVLLLPGVLLRVSGGGGLCVLRHPRDQEQDVRGDQPDVRLQGGGARDPGPGPSRPAQTEEDERIRNPGEWIAGV